MMMMAPSMLRLDVISDSVVTLMKALTTYMVQRVR